MLGPTLFIILLNVVLEKSGCCDVVGVEFVCKDRGVWTCSADIRDMTFQATDGAYANDAWFLAKSPEQAASSDRATGIGCLSEDDRMALAVW